MDDVLGTNSYFFPLGNIPTRPVEDSPEDQTGAGVKLTAQYFEHHLQEKYLPVFYSDLPFTVKISTLYIDSVAELKGKRDSMDSDTGEYFYKTGYKVFPKPDQHEYPEIYIPETGEIVFVYNGEERIVEQQTQCVQHSKTQVLWNPRIQEFIGTITTWNGEVIPFNWKGDLLQIPVINSKGEKELYSIFGIAPNIPHDVINRSEFLRNSITTIEFLSKDQKY